MKLPFNELKSFLDEKVDRYNRESFIELDPVSIPHRFEIPQDIEIAGFLAATIAWGQRKSIVQNASRLMAQMGNAPYDFILTAKPSQQEKASQFVHRTFNSTDTLYFFQSLRHIYQRHGGLQAVFEKGFQKEKDVKGALVYFRNVFFETGSPMHALKHVSDVECGSSAKRLNMFLRWMVRNDKRGVDFGLWKSIPAGALYLPLDLHTGNVSRKLGLLQRKQNDWKAVEEVTQQLRLLDPQDPVKYDFALFGLGIFEKF